MKSLTHKVQTGFTMVELMISALIAMIAMASVISVFSMAVSSNSSSLKSIRLNQELRAIMDVMVLDIRRSGYWSASTGSYSVSNKFSTMNINGALDCITYSYDLNDDDSNDADDKQGFKLVGNGVSLRANSATCADSAAADWVSISDLKAIKITKLQFVVQPKANSCLNISGGADCTISGDSITYMDVVDITLAGELAGDASVTDSLQEVVAIRNTITSVVP